MGCRKWVFDLGRQIPVQSLLRICGDTQGVEVSGSFSKMFCSERLVPMLWGLGRHSAVTVGQAAAVFDLQSFSGAEAAIPQS